VEGKLVGVKMEAPNLEGETQHSFMEHPEKEDGGRGLAGAALPVVAAGANFMPDTLDKFACLGIYPVMCNLPLNWLTNK
jgi:hypothetical protein